MKNNYDNCLDPYRHILSYINNNEYLEFTEFNI